MKALELIHGGGVNPSLQYLLGDSRVSKQYQNEIVVELSSSSSVVVLKDVIEASVGRAIEDISVDIRVVIPVGVTIDPYQHVGSTGLDAIDLTGIPNDKGIIVENYGTIIGSGGLGSVGIYTGSNQSRNGTTGHGGSCFKMVDLEKFILINEGNLYGGKGVGANGSGGRGGNGSGGAGVNSHTGQCSISNTWVNSTYSIGAGGNGGEWDGSGYSAWTRATADGGYTWKQLEKFISNSTGTCTTTVNYQNSISMSSVAGGGGVSTIGGWDRDLSAADIISYIAGSPAPSNGGAGGSAGGKGAVSLGYGQGKVGANGGTAGQAGGTGGSKTYVVSGTTGQYRTHAGTTGGGTSGSAGSNGNYGNGGGVLTSATITEYQVVNNGSILSGKDLDSNRGGYLL